MLFVPSKHKEKVNQVLISSQKLLTRYFVGIGFQITGIILLITFGMTIIGVDFRSGLVIGLLAGIFNVIPYLGPIIGTLVGMTVGMATQISPDTNIELFPIMGYMLIVFIIVQVVDNVVFQPFIYSSSVHAHPLEVFLIILLSGSLAGVIGMLLAIPTYTIIRVIAKEFFSNFEIVQKITHRL
jgi:predicted PurR-regulated permease PerM